MMINIHKWNDCDIPIFKQYKNKFHERCETLYIYNVQDVEAHYDTFSLYGNILNYDSYMRNKYELTDEECYACIAHEIGHSEDTFSRQAKRDSDEEGQMRSYIREFHADEHASKQGLENELISALKKMCPKDNFLNLLRTKRLQELKRRRESVKHNTKVTSIPVMVFALLLRDNGYTEWDRKNHPEADIIVNNINNVKEKFYFEIKETNSITNVFEAATLTEWSAACNNNGHYFFVVIYLENDNELPKYIFYTPQEIMQFSTVPPFKININIPKLPTIEQTLNDRLMCIQNEPIVEVCQWKNHSKSRRNSVKFDGKMLLDLKRIYYGELKKKKD